MMNIIVKQIDNRNEWEAFLEKHEEVNFLQSWYWGEFHKRLGNKIQRSGFYKDGKLAGVMLSIVEDARRGRYLTVPGGPIVDWSDREIADAVFAEMKRIAIGKRCVFVRIRPQLIGNQGDQKINAREIFKSHGCSEAPMHLHAELSSILGITKSEEQLLALMRKTTRYEIRRAANLGIKIETSKDENAIKSFYDLQKETAKRQRFVPFSYSFFKEQFKVFFDAGLALLYTASLEGRVLAQAFIIFYGAEAAYHYGASTLEARKYPAAYLLQWEAIKEAKRRGMKRYNFWGVAPEEAKNHRFYGVSVFKRGFGGEDVEYLHAQDLVINKFRYSISYFIESIRKRLRRV